MSDDFNTGAPYVMFGMLGAHVDPHGYYRYQDQ